MRWRLGVGMVPTLSVTLLRPTGIGNPVDPLRFESPIIHEYPCITKGYHDASSKPMCSIQQRSGHAPYRLEPGRNEAPPPLVPLRKRRRKMRSHPLRNQRGSTLAAQADSGGGMIGRSRDVAKHRSPVTSLRANFDLDAFRRTRHRTDRHRTSPGGLERSFHCHRASPRKHP